MNWFSGLPNPFAPKTVAKLEAEKAAELAKVTKSYDDQLAAARAKEAAAAPAAVGTTPAVGGRKKTRRGKKKSKKSRKH
jgi:hypothetical protein